MERISIQDVAAVLVEKNGLRKKDAERFAVTLFEVVKDGLAADRHVKIKGLGTFKIIDIEARKSVNVNTGEHVVIEGHDKITFTPDTTMKELVNRPFSQFETVVLNDGVDFDDTDTTSAAPAEDEEEEEVQVIEEQPAVEMPEVEVLETEVPEVEVPETEASEEITEEKLGEKPEEMPEEKEDDDAPMIEFVDTIDETEEKEIIEEAGEREEETEEVEVEETDSDMEKPFYRSKAMLGLVAGLLACVVSFAVGYHVGFNKASSMMVDSLAEKPAAEMPDTIHKAVTDSATTTDSVSAPVEASANTPDTMAVKAKPSEKVEPVAAPVAAPVEKTVAAPVVETDKYEQMDSRVRTGAYRIVGTDMEVKVRAGETIQRISRRTLGPDMECYIEVYNGLSSNAQLKEGQTLKIPKLELKKKKKQTNKN